MLFFNKLIKFELWHACLRLASDGLPHPNASRCRHPEDDKDSKDGGKKKGKGASAGDSSKDKDELDIAKHLGGEHSLRE